MTIVVAEDAFAVFDPLGGAGSDRVIRSAVDAFRLGVEAHGDVSQALLRANDAVHAAIDADATLRGAGCTAGAFSLRQSQLTVAWVGDVHVLRFRTGALRALTRAHSMLDDGARVRRDPAHLSPSHRKQLAGVIVRALGMTRDLDVETRTSSVEPGDVFVILCDGLFNALGVGLLGSLIRQHQEDLHTAVRVLLDTGRANGGRGTLTVVLVAASDGAPAPSVAALSEAA